MTTKWISQIFNGGGGAPKITPPTNPDASEADDDREAAPKAPRKEEEAEQKPTPENYDMSKVDMNKFVVILLYGKNSFGDTIYSYLKITLGGIEKLKAAMLLGLPFTPSDFGSIIAAGRGEPTDEVKAEIGGMYYVMTAQTEEVAPRATKVEEPISWDEY